MNINVGLPELHKKMTAGNNWMLLIDHEGYLWGKGSNGYGMLGDGVATWDSVPMHKIESAGAGWVSVDAGYMHSVGLKEDGTVWVWGRGSYGALADGYSGTDSSYHVITPIQVALPGSALQVVCGETTVFALLEDGSVYGWGGMRGECGQPASDYLRISTPHKAPAVPAESGKVVRIGAGTSSGILMRLTELGDLYTSGTNRNGNIGNGTYSTYKSPTNQTTPFLFGKDYYSMGSSLDMTYGVKKDGTVWVTGLNHAYSYNGSYYYNLGIDTGTSNTYVTTPTLIPSLSDIKKVESGHVHTIALDTHGNVYAWGLNSYGGEVSDPLLGEHWDSGPLPPLLLTGKVTDIEVGDYVNLFVYEDSPGDIWGTGYTYGDEDPETDWMEEQWFRILYESQESVAPDPEPAREPTPDEAEFVPRTRGKGRIRLRFDRNKDMRTEYYYLYRSLEKNVSKRNARIMKIMHHKRENTVEIKGDKAHRISDSMYQLTHSSIIEEEPVVIYHNGNVLPSHRYEMNFKRGLITFHGTSFAEEDVIVSDYFFDGIEVIDDSVEQPSIMEYYGPYAEDVSRPTIPTNLSMKTDNKIGAVTLAFNPSETAGQMYYYRIEARGKRENWSELSPEIGAFLKASIDQYQVEASVDGNKWVTVGSTKTLSWTDFKADREPPEPIRNGTAVVTPQKNRGYAFIDFAWKVPLVNQKTSYTPLYRVRAVSDSGVISEPSVSIGPEIIKSELDKIVVRRKVSDGFSFPSYNGSDAITVGEITDISESTFRDNVEDETVYAYSLYVVDKSGNYSPATTFEVAVAKTAAPIQVAGILIEPYNHII